VRRPQRERARQFRRRLRSRQEWRLLRKAKRKEKGLSNSKPQQRQIQLVLRLRQPLVRRFLKKENTKANLANNLSRVQRLRLRA
jgi:hypothetical protein